jgi:YHS domain-containing protein
MKTLIVPTLVTFFLSIGLGFKAEAQRQLDPAPEQSQVQNKLIEDALAMNTNAPHKDTNSIVQPIGLPKPLIQDMTKEVYVKSYKVDYKGGTRYFPSSAEGEAFMRQLNNNYQKNLIPYPGIVSGYYTTTLVQGLVDYGRWYSKAEQYK